MLDTKKKFAIVGFASSSRTLAPFGDPDWYIAGMNSLYAIIPRTPADRTVWYEMHRREHFEKDLNRTELKQQGLVHVDWMKKVPGEGVEGHFPIFTQERFEDIPASVRWPREDINRWTREKLGANAELDYFTSTPGLMMAHAIFLGFKEIGLWGVDLLQDQEYAYQRPGCEYWIGVARGMGIKVSVPSSSSLIKANYVYGYTEPPSDEKTVRPLADFFTSQEKKVEGEQHKQAADANACVGAVQAYGIILNKMKEEGATMETLQAWCESEDTRLKGIVGQANISLERMNALREAFVSCSAYTLAWGRGDKLEGM